MNNAFYSVLEHAIQSKLIEKEDLSFFENRLTALLSLDTPPERAEATLSFPKALKVLSDYAAKSSVIEDTAGERDIFETEIAGMLTPRPSEIISRFYAEDTESAINYFYALCRNNNYIRCEDIAKNVEYTADTEFGELEITINLSKPEKDPRDIARAASVQSSNYPKCALCAENEGYKGRSNHPPRANLRIVPITLQGEKWGFQYSPYAYFTEHSILLSYEHKPMSISRDTFDTLTEFVGKFPTYFAGSNADLPIVGGSILSHEHYQCGRHTFPMMKAKIDIPLTFKGYEELECGHVRWPMPCIRIKGENRDGIISLAEKILKVWRGYTDVDAYILAETDGVPHNTITPIAYRDGEKYVLDLVLRNNITTEECPLGLYHPHGDKHNIKKENIGLIEVMGMAILPARLKTELEEVERVVQNALNPEDNPLTAHHAEWIKRYGFTASQSLESEIRSAVADTFAKVLEDSGVYKIDDTDAFMRFIKKVNGV